MDKIYIKDLEVYAFHGVFNEEKAIGQKFLISLELSLNLREAGNYDDINKTVNYAEICNNVENTMKRERFDLIEKCAEEIAKNILIGNLLVEKVKVTVKKPWAPIGKSLDYVAVEITRCWHSVYIGLGSNMGDKNKNLKDAISMMNSGETRVMKVSSFYETKPVGYTEQDDFLNCAAEIKTLLSPTELIRFLIQIEKKLKRERVFKWGPRTIDLDILLFDDGITFSEEIIIPHPRLHERLFVLMPLCEIAAYAVHPILNKRIIDLKEEAMKVQEL